jgi:uncharacterized protein YdaU (DUF1376 family)
VTELPDPLAPLDCDLRGMSFMPLHVVTLRDSDFTAITTGDEFKAGVLLWAASWTQVPAASLPDDDRVLARLAGLTLEAWLETRFNAFRGWVLCSDGRYYHPVIAEEALKAWAKREANDDRRAVDRERLRKWREAKKAKAAKASAQPELAKAETPMKRVSATLRNADGNAAETSKTVTVTVTPSDDKSSSVLSTLRADTDRTFQALWALWPSVARKRHSQAQTRKALEAAIKAGAKPDDLILAGQRHVAERGARGDEFVKGLVPWLRADLWRNWLDEPGGSVIDAAPEIWAKRLARWQGDNEAWNRAQWGPPPNELGYRGPRTNGGAHRQPEQRGFAL